MKFGFECEFFLRDKDTKEFRIVTQFLPKDDCGYLVEVRGEPHTDPIKAAYLWAAEFKKVRELVPPALELVTSPYEILPKPFLLQCLRAYGKNSAHERGMCGKLMPVDKYSRAGLHVHFSNQVEYEEYDRGDRGHFKNWVSGMIDIPKYVLALDKAFKSQIKEAKRVPGLYEMKAHGFEYRSLPNTVLPGEVAEVLRGIE